MAAKKTYTREELAAARNERDRLRDSFMMLNPTTPGFEQAHLELRSLYVEAARAVERIERWFRRNYGWSN